MSGALRTPLGLRTGFSVLENPAVVQQRPGAVGLEFVVIAHFGLCPLTLLHPVDQVVQHADYEVPDCIADFVLDSADVLVVLSFGALSRSSKSLPRQLVKELQTFSELHDVLR
ncbi:Hypothetical protein SMAX5B_007715 [Scophthalmus maximus]|uniref:Uncharacterized protein n=1 Tax=Scophthalmus maximus TaxID=52904 RepID=A0A2U9C8W3_SCOMX|nr:Hypothetical protein SMAX5B_007715 [Scophthalmus maximus]